MRLNTRFERPDARHVAALAAHGTATIHEAQGRRGALSSTLKPVDRAMNLCGPAFTVECAPRDNIMLQMAIAYASPGDVIVVSAGAYAEAGTFGDVLGSACVVRGIAGLVTDSGVRDTMGLIALGFPVFSGSVSIRGTVKESVGTFNAPIVIGGETIRAGDIVRGDADGLVVVRREEAEEVARLSAARDATEANAIAALRQGTPVAEICNLQAWMDRRGVTVD
ncbi:4-carboxy-4-hydroxy-2-oxoadipate aldolase/oxaloacetate decarboxylase [Acuticoccus kandeliae]|uniref:4-carboxy-4-hydroxy-2-oxoadipate aldolase/oxaloacetate decarboxylase n=1 Tax=Acuticoccus kandeliae TaxID=2073160 RepID=UPI000D3E185A|nr:4-carboxy-4-hydroxy-2-oxoadipate aldolase/oxaloacetate decarboxylase [Acuticoccus kandeliae]